MTLSDRDKKIVLVLVPLLLAAAYWFLLLAPKREAATTAGAELSKQEQRRDAATAELARVESARRTFASDYAELVRLGKAIPSSVDMPSLIVQLERAAAGTGIAFKRIATGAREDAPSGAPSGAAQPPAAPGSGSGSQPAAAGGAPAQSGPGQVSETAGNATNTANSASASREGTGGGGLPVGGGTPTGGASPAGQSSGVAGLDSVPLELAFEGSFFNLADFFHRLKRFVNVANNQVLVQGRLLTVDGFSFSSDEESFPGLKAEIKATVYLAPKSQGATAGATPNGPSSTVPASGAQSAPSAPVAPAPTPPSAVATP